MTIPEYYNPTLATISKNAGFNSISVFNRSFKRVTGITPSYYLKQVNNSRHATIIVLFLITLSVSFTK